MNAVRIAGFLICVALYCITGYATAAILRDTALETGRPAFCGDHQCPNFTVIESNQEYELRRYEPTTWVATEQTGNGWFARSGMFRRLARYTLRGYNNEGLRMPMTAPVLTKISTRSPRIMYFMLPDAQQENPPTPTDPQVTIAKMPALNIYVRSFGGFARGTDWNRQVEALKATLGPEAVYNNDMFYRVGYNSPWTMVDRHNEVWLVAEERSRQAANQL